jgi:small subunit ribosomal protein S16
VSVRIRLKRIGRRRQPSYRIAVMDRRRTRDSLVIEEVGNFNPLRKDEQGLSLKRDRVEYWLGVGAQPTDTVRRLLEKQGILKETPVS